MPEGVVAAVIAAGKWKGEAPPGTWRALTPLAGRPMLAYVLDALSASNTVNEMVVIGPSEFSEPFPQVTLLDPTQTLTGNVLVAARAARGKGRVLLVGSDIPLLTPAAVDDFVTACPADRAFCYSIIEKSVVMERYPDMKRTFVRLSDGTYTGGNLILADPEFLIERDAVIEGIYANRKRPLALAGSLGWEVSLRLALTALLRLPLLDVPRAERLVGRTLGGTVAGVPTLHAAIGADLDSVDEIPQFEALLKADGH